MRDTYATNSRLSFLLFNEFEFCLESLSIYKFDKNLHLISSATDKEIKPIFLHLIQWLLIECADVCACIFARIVMISLSMRIIYLDNPHSYSPDYGDHCIQRVDTDNGIEYHHFANIK